jgi:hypothetical protein
MPGQSQDTEVGAYQYGLLNESFKDSAAAEIID